VQSEIPFETIVVDAGLPDATAARLTSIPGLRVIRKATSLGYGEACNSSLWRSRAKLIMLVNHDIRVEPGMLEALERTMEDPAIAMAGATILLPDRRIEEAGWLVHSDSSLYRYGRWGNADDFRYDYFRDADLANLSAVIVRREALEATGGLDEWIVRFPFDGGYTAFRIRSRGLRTVFQPRARAIHDIGIEAGVDALERAIPEGVPRWDDMDRELAVALTAQPVPGHDTIERCVRQVAGGTVVVAGHSVPDSGGDTDSQLLAAIVGQLQDQGERVIFIPADGRDGGSHSQAWRDQGVEVAWQKLMWPDYFGSLRGTAKTVTVVGPEAASLIEPILRETQPDADFRRL
jgi:hypothetical protein